MTLVAAELADLGPGVVPLHEPVDVGALELACDERGRPLVVLDTTDVADQDGFMLAMEAAMSLPEWSNPGWAALASELQAVPATTVLLWDHWEALAARAPGVYELAVEVLGDSGLTVLLAQPGS